MNEDYLEHYGIKGMHWGIRRFQNADGSLTAAGKKRYGSGEGSKESSHVIDGKKIAKGAVMAASVAGAAYLYSKNKKAIDRYVAIQATRIFTKAEKNIKEAPYKVPEKLGRMKDNFVKGAAEGLERAPYKMGKAMIEGAAYIAGSYAIGKAIGKVRVEDMRQSYNAYNKKDKIGKVTDMDDFMRGESRYYDEDDDED